jgi:malyl-CoA/(S)-citramalyl-CoA lyase
MPAIPGRLNRSELSVPAIRPELFAKAAMGQADVILIDLEDSVAAADKPQARANAIRALREVDFKSKTVSVRINAMDTPFLYRDVIELIEQGGERLDLLMLPKTGSVKDVHALDALVSQVELAVGRKKRLGFELLIESAMGVADVEAIARASERNEALHFGMSDFAASIQSRATGIGGFIPEYGVLADRQADGQRPFHFGDPWHFALARIVVAARAAGLRAVEGPYGDFGDPEGFIAQAKRAAALGCEGKWAIHPSQIGPANAIFSPRPEEIAQARRIIQALEEGARKGLGAVALDGKMIDRVSARQAEGLLALVERTGGSTEEGTAS